MLMLHEDSVHTMSTMQQQCNVHGAMFTILQYSSQGVPQLAGVKQR